MQPTATDISTQCSQALRRRAGDKDKKAQLSLTNPRDAV